MDNEKLMKTEEIIDAMIVCNYFPRIYFRKLTEKQKEAFVEVYNCLFDEIIDREVME